MTTRPWGVPGVLAAALLMAAAPAWTQAPSILRAGFDAAWAQQPEHQAAALRREAAAAAVNASQRWTPEPLSLEASAKTDRFHHNDGAREYDAALAVPLWWPGERARVQDAASAEAAVVEARLRAARWRLAAEVREAYWQWQRARIDHTLATQRLDAARRLADDVARRVRAGDLARADGHQAESAVAAAQGGVADAAVALVSTAAAWTALTGAPPVDGAPEARPAASALDDHPVLRELAVRSDLVHRQHALASAQTRPNPELVLGAVRERDATGERYAQSVVVGLRVPLGTSAAAASRTATAGADRVEADAQRAIEARRVRAQVDVALARVQALEAAWAANDRRATLARESRGFVDKAFRLGEADLPTRLRFEHDAAEAESQAARSQVDVHAAISELRQALGLLPE